jgi:CHASE3 domain sensor protein
MTEQQLQLILSHERQICDAKLQGLKDVFTESLKGRDKAVELLVSSQGQRLNAYIAIVVAVVMVVELALRLLGK